MNTLFDMDGIATKSPTPKKSPDRYVLFYEHDGKVYLGRRRTATRDTSGYDWIEEGASKQKPTGYKNFFVARRYANELNKRRTAAGERENITVRVKLLT